MQRDLDISNNLSNEVSLTMSQPVPPPTHDPPERIFLANSSRKIPVHTSAPRQLTTVDPLSISGDRTRLPLTGSNPITLANLPPANAAVPNLLVPPTPIVAKTVQPYRYSLITNAGVTNPLNLHDLQLPKRIASTFFLYVIHSFKKIYLVMASNLMSGCHYTARCSFPKETGWLHDHTSDNRTQTRGSIDDLLHSQWCPRNAPAVYVQLGRHGRWRPSSQPWVGPRELRSYHSRHRLAWIQGSELRHPRLYTSFHNRPIRHCLWLPATNEARTRHRNIAVYPLVDD